MILPPGHLAEDLSDLLLAPFFQDSSTAMPSVAPPVWVTIIVLNSLVLKPSIDLKNHTNDWQPEKTRP